MEKPSPYLLAVRVGCGELVHGVQYEIIAVAFSLQPIFRANWNVLFTLLETLGKVNEQRAIKDA